MGENEQAMEVTNVKVVDAISDNKETKDNSYEETDWPLGDVLRYTKEGEAKKVSVYTVSPKVLDGNLKVDIGPDLNEISFLSDRENLVDEEEAERFGFTKSTDQQNGKEVIIYENVNARLEITKAKDPGLHQAKISFNDSHYAYYGIEELGMGDILKDHDLPKETTKEYAEGLISGGLLKVGRREIPIEKIEDRRNLPGYEEPLPEGKTHVYHGSSLKDALTISRIGLFAEGGDKQYRPILAESASGISATLATDEWESYKRTDSSGYGAIVVFRVDPSDIERSGEVRWAEKLFHPTEMISDQDEIYRLQKGTRTSLPNIKPRYLSYRKIEKIILIKQTPRKNY